MDVARRAVLLAPVGIKKGFSIPGAARWPAREFEMRKLLGKASSIEVPSSAEDHIRGCLPSGVLTSPSRKHKCIMFESGVAVLQIELEVTDPRALLNRWAEEHEDALHKRLFAIAAQTLPEVVEPAADVDWTYTVADVDAYIHDQFDSAADEATARAANAASVPAPLTIGAKAEARIWVEWSAAQVANFSALAESEALPVEHILEVFIVRCACWKLLTVCGQRATTALGDFETNRTQSVVSELRSLQLVASQLLVAYHTSLWTTDRYLVTIFDAIDDAWDAEREVGKTRDLLEVLGTALSTHHETEVVQRDQALARRDRVLANVGLSLAGLTFLSAVADTYGVLVNGFNRVMVVSIVIPAVVVGGVVAVLSWWFKRPAPT